MSGDNGIAGNKPVEGVQAYVVIVFTSIALYNVFELTFMIWSIFKRRSSVYFWSYVVATYGIPFYSGGFILRAKATTKVSWAYATMIAIGWVMMVTGQSMIMWSRLHLILHNDRKIELIFWMIVCNAIFMHGPSIVMLYGVNSGNPTPWIRPYSIYEKVEVTMFFIQETIISSVYIAEAYSLSRLQSDARRGNTPLRIMRNLIAINIFIIFIDITLITFEYADLYDIQTAFKAFAYSTKFKMEFRILNQLVQTASCNRHWSISAENPGTSSSQRETYNNIDLESNVVIDSAGVRNS